MASKEKLTQPEKEERLAIKQEKRIRRLHYLRSRLPTSPQWWVKIGEISGVALLFSINFFLLFPFFGHEDKANVFSAPVMPVLASLTEKLLPFSYSIRVWLLVFLVFFPLSYYYFVKEVSGRKLVGLISSLVVILPVGVFLPLRVNLGLMSEDGAHVASLTLIPLVCLLLLHFLRRGNFWEGVFSALGTTLVALTSPLGFVVLTVFMGVVTFSEMLLGQGRLKMIRFLVVICLAAGFSAFWYNPKFVLMTMQSSQGQLVKQTFANLLPVSFFLLPMLGVFGFLLFENRPQLQPMFIAFFLTVAFGLFSLGTGVVHHSPSRFLLAFGISFSFLFGVLAVWLFDFLRLSPKLGRLKIAFIYRQLIAFGFIGLLLSLMILVIGFSGKSLWQLEKTQVLGLTTEQKVGIWEIKGQTSSAGRVFGYTITTLSLVSVGLIQRKLRGDRGSRK
jgi:hypothetical protein